MEYFIFRNIKGLYKEITSYHSIRQIESYNNLKVGGEITLFDSGVSTKLKIAKVKGNKVYFKEV